MTNRVTASEAALSGTCTTIPDRSTTSAIGSTTPRRETNDGDGSGGDAPGSLARIRRQRSKFDRVSLRARQKTLTVYPDRFQASMATRQTLTFSGRRLDMTEFSHGENSKVTRRRKASFRWPRTFNTVFAEPRSSDQPPIRSALWPLETDPGIKFSAGQSAPRGWDYPRPPVFCSCLANAPCWERVSHFLRHIYTIEDREKLDKLDFNCFIRRFGAANSLNSAAQTPRKVSETGTHARPEPWQGTIKKHAWVSRMVASWRMMRPNRSAIIGSDPMPMMVERTCPRPSLERFLPTAAA